MYKLPDGNDEIYNKYITHLTKEDLLNGVDLTEALSRRLFSLTLTLGGGNIPDKELGGLEFEMDMGVDDWPIGQVTYKKMAFTVANDSSDIEDGMKTGQVVKPVIGLQALDGVSKETTLKVPYGTYIVDSIAKDMTMKNYSCYDQLYYINDVDCDFGGETYPTTVGHVLSTITGKYADKGMIPLSDSHQGDWAPWWNDVLGQPKKYKDYEGPVEEEEDDGIDMDPITPVEDNFPQDAGSPPTKNPGKCCDCEPGQGGGGGTTPEPEENGLFIILNEQSELFPGMKWSDTSSRGTLDSVIHDQNSLPKYAPLWCRIEPYDTELNDLREDDFCFYNCDKYRQYEAGFEIKWESDDIEILEFDSDSSSYRQTRYAGFVVKSPGTVTVTVKARKTDKGLKDHDYIPDGFTAEAKMTIKIPEVSSKTLLDKYWKGEKPTPSTVVRNWSFEDINGGGIYNSCSKLSEQTGYLKFGHSGTQFRYGVVMDSPENSLLSFATTHWENAIIRLLPNEPFNTKYAVISVTNIDSRIREYFIGLGLWFGNLGGVKEGESIPYNSFEGSSIQTKYTCTANNCIKYSSSYDYDCYKSDGVLEKICIPNYFLSDTSWRVNFQYAPGVKALTSGRCSILALFDENKLYNEDSDLYFSLQDESAKLIQFKIEYFGDANLDKDDYKFLTCFGGPDSDLRNKRPFIGPTYHLFDYSEVIGDFPTKTNGYFYHLGTPSNNNWWPEALNTLLVKTEIDNNYQNAEIPLLQSGKVGKSKDSIWYDELRLVGNGWSSGDLCYVNPEGEIIDRSSNSGTVTENVSYSLMSLPRTVSAPAYNEDGNLIVTYAEEPDPNDPSQTPNGDGQVLVTTPEEIGFEMKEGQMLGYIAAYCGGNIVMDHTGEVRLLRLTDNITTDENGKESIGYDKHIPNSQVAIPEIDNCEASSTLGGLIIHTSTYEGDDIKLGSEKPSQTHYVLEIDNPFMTEERATEIFEEMSSLTYFPMRVVILSDPRLWLGDLLYFDGFSQYNEASGVNVEVIREGYYPVMKLISHYDGAPSLQIEANCSSLSDRSNSFTGSLNDKIDEVSAKVTETNKTVNEMKYEVEEIRALVGYFNELFAIEVNADNIVSATINTRNIRIAPTKGKTEGGVYIDGDSIDFIDNEGVQRLHIGSSGDDKDYYIRFLNENGYTRDLRALDPGPCCCDGSGGGGTTPKPEDPGTEEPKPEGLIINVDDAAPLFADRDSNDNRYRAYEIGLGASGRTYRYVIQADISPYDDLAREKGKSFEESIYVNWSIDAADLDKAEIDFDDSYARRRPSIRIKKPGKIKIKAKTVRSSTAPVTDVPEDYYAEGSVTIEVPEVTKDTLMEKYWGRDSLISSGSISTEPKIYVSDLAGWDPTVKGGGIYNSSELLSKQTYQIIPTKSAEAWGNCYYGIYLMGEKMKYACMQGYSSVAKDLSAGQIPKFTIRPCEVFNSQYMVITISKVRDEIKDYVHGLGFAYGIDDNNKVVISGYHAGNTPQVKTCYTNTEDGIGNGAYFKGYAFYPGTKSISIPNYFISNNSYYTNFQGFPIYQFESGGNAFYLDWSITSSGLNPPELFDGSPLVEFTIEYYGKKKLSEEEYKYLTTHTGDSDYHPYLGTRYIGAYNNMRIYHSGLNSCSNFKWHPFESYVALREYYQSDGANTYYSIPLNPDTGEVLKMSDSIWYNPKDDPTVEEANNTEIVTASYQVIDDEPTSLDDYLTKLENRIAELEAKLNESEGE